jgi:hypothetical protein
MTSDQVTAVESPDFKGLPNLPPLAFPSRHFTENACLAKQKEGKNILFLSIWLNFIDNALS